MISLTEKNQNHVVLAIDGSEHAVAAVNYLKDLKLPSSCSLSIITVLIPRNAQYHATLESMLEQTKNIFKLKEYPVSTHLLTGYPAEQIVQFSAENNPKLLVLGAKGLRGTIRILLGGVAQQVVNYVQCPVLIVRAPHTMVQRALLVTDGSEHSEYLIQYLEHCPLPIDSQVTVMHVLPPEMTTEMLIRSWPYGIDTLPHVLTNDITDSITERSKGEEEDGKELLSETVIELAQIGINADSILLRGDAATEILNYAENNRINLIIAGSRGLSQIQSLFLGSVSSKLIHYANCSVLIVKKPGKNLVFESNPL